LLIDEQILPQGESRTSSKSVANSNGELAEMDRRFAKFALLIAGALVQELAAQRTPPAANVPWHSKEEQEVAREVVADRQPSWHIDPQKVYTLSELIDLAELHNPETDCKQRFSKPNRTGDSPRCSRALVDDAIC